MKQCDMPTEGWYCTRQNGHDGPCAAWPYGESKMKPIETTLVIKTVCSKCNEEMCHKGEKMSKKGRFTLAILAVVFMSVAFYVLVGAIGRVVTREYDKVVPTKVNQ